MPSLTRRTLFKALAGGSLLLPKAAEVVEAAAEEILVPERKFWPLDQTMIYKDILNQGTTPDQLKIRPGNLRMSLMNNQEYLTSTEVNGTQAMSRSKNGEIHNVERIKWDTQDWVSSQPITHLAVHDSAGNLLFTSGLINKDLIAIPGDEVALEPGALSIGFEWCRERRRG